MKHLGILALLSAALFATAPASAQSSGGLLMDRDIVTPSDLFELSQTTFSLGTARSMAMAGAFTSLGADVPAQRNFDHASDEFRTGGKQRSGIQLQQ